MFARATPYFTDYDQHLFNQGTHYSLYRKMGGRLLPDGSGAVFSVWAPNAKSVAVVGDFNFWDPNIHLMERLGDSGVWQLSTTGVRAGQRYKFAITGADQKQVFKIDPFGLQFELRPSNAAILTDMEAFEWHDHGWMETRAERSSQEQPINIYEVHLGSWRRWDGGFMSYPELGRQLAAYCQEMGFTHVELLPVTEHPLDESWGYQCTGFFAPTSRHGSFQEFQQMVDILHQHEIAVIMDWVPGHFPSDEWALANFDGSALYEHEDPRQGLHPHWGTLIFNYSRREVSNFLLASALFWLEVMHIDGLRVDAVASMLYLDYGRKDGEWIPNRYAGKENLEAIEFLRHLNSQVHERHPGVLTIAEESTSFPGVTQAVEDGGLGFDYKWNMGWMNDTLAYFREDPINRSYHHAKLTFGLLYVFGEQFMSVLSHDEVVHGKASLISKMPGSREQKFANLRLLYSYMCCQPGKNLLFMGGELGQWDEWDCGSAIQWHLLDYGTHREMQRMVKDLNHFVRRNPAMWERDSDSSGFQWVEFRDSDHNVISYLRKSSKQTLLCIHNFCPVLHQNYELHLDGYRDVRPVFNSDAACYGGSAGADGQTDWRRIPNALLVLDVAPLATQIFEVN